jgi:hypothetical protein
VRVISAAVLTALGVVTLAFGGHDGKTYGFALVFLAAAAAHFSYACWELSIARSQSA